MASSKAVCGGDVPYHGWRGVTVHVLPPCQASIGVLLRARDRRAWHQGPHVPKRKSTKWYKGHVLIKIPGLDGFTRHFYKCCWSIIKSDVLATLVAFQCDDVRNLSVLNSAFLALILKREDDNQVKYLWLISLIYNFVKLVAKILANRLAEKLDILIALNQSAFFKGRCTRQLHACSANHQISPSTKAPSHTA